MSSDQHDPTEGLTPEPGKWLSMAEALRESRAEVELLRAALFTAYAEGWRDYADGADLKEMWREAVVYPMSKSRETTDTPVQADDTDLIVEVWEGSSTVLVRRGERGQRVFPWQVHFHSGPHPDFAEEQEVTDGE